MRQSPSTRQTPGQFLAEEITKNYNRNGHNDEPAAKRKKLENITTSDTMRLPPPPIVEIRYNHHQPFPPPSSLPSPTLSSQPLSPPLPRPKSFIRNGLMDGAKTLFIIIFVLLVAKCTVCYYNDNFSTTATPSPTSPTSPTLTKPSPLPTLPIHQQQSQQQQYQQQQTVLSKEKVFQVLSQPNIQNFAERMSSIMEKMRNYQSDVNDNGDNDGKLCDQKSRVLQEKKNTVGELNEQLAKVEQLKKERQGKEEKIVTLTNQLAEIEHGRQNLKFNLDEILERKMQRQKTLSKENKKINFYNSFTHIDPSQNPINAILKSARDGIVVSRIHDAHGEEYTIARDVESVISAPIKPYIDQLNELRRRFEKNKEKDAKDLFAVFNDVEDEDQKLLSSYQKIRSTQREREMKVIKNLENFINGQLEGIKETIDSSATQEAGELFKKVEKNLAGIREEISRLEKENKNDETLEKQITGQYMISQVESGKKENELNESKKSLQKLKDEIDISTSSTDITVGAISEIEKKISLLEQELVKCHEDQNRIKEDGKKLEQLLSLVNPIATNFEKIINQIEFIH